MDNRIIELPISFAETLKQRCPKIGQVDDIELYGVPLETVNISGQVQRFVFGTEEEEKKKKTILLVGTGGSGKRTFINSLTNNVFCVKERDTYRFQLIDDEAASQQDKGITIYDIHKADRIFSLSIIDTPSYVETNNNLESLKNREINDLIHKYFFDGIQDVDSIGFVIKATQTKLTPTQVFIFDSLTTIFGSEIKKKISFLLTFADGRELPALEAIKNELHYDQTLLIQIYKINIAGRLHIAEDRVFDWIVEGVQKFLSDLFYYSRSSTGLLRELKCCKIKAKRIEATEIGLESQIEAELNKIDTGDYNYQKCILPFGQHAANCQKCRMTCHHTCSCEEMSNCSVMDHSKLDVGQRTCHVCSCLSSEHARQPYR